ncbi:hypothetical protein QBC40DRAFT_273371 [Triangularia verruculosa]|uniref:Uncharacterized protein n=1 Tax=Triangularia verruculosa TaxID=2587418 RepID=A0AAN7AYC3_9PEZI|nr:hypothetical protein QBC40DRAFT_273371 [Triangularia verruculosa]
MTSNSTTDELTSSVTKLSLKTSSLDKSKLAPKKKAAAPVADSWEDEDEDDEPEETPLGNTQAGTNAPPPTPMSPVAKKQPFSPSALNAPGTFGFTSFDTPGGDSSPRSAGSAPDKRPEKTDAVARRMIAAGLGLRAPRATEEQKAYDRAVREQEKKRREEERERQRKKEEEAQKAKQAIWDD